jgi:hypothetical protein
VAIVGRADEDNTATSITFRAQPDGESPLCAAAAPRTLRPGTEELGDLVLRPDVLVAAGRCTIDGEPGELPRGCRVEFLERREGRDDRWRHADELRRSARADGTFEFRGQVAAERLRLVLGKQEFLGFAPLEFAPGAADLVVALTRGAELAASMLMPEGAPQMLLARLAPADGEPREADNAQVQPRPDGRQQAQWRGLAAGTYLLWIEVDGIAEPVFRVEGIAVPPPPGGDPRLVDIDLRGLLMVQEIRLAKTAGEGHGDFAGNGGIFPLGQPEGGELRGVSCWGSSIKLLLPRGAVPVLVAIGSHRPQELLCQGTPLEVRLEPWPKAVVTVTTEIALPAPATLQLVLDAPGGDGRRWTAQWSSGRVAELLEAPTRRITVQNGRAELAVGETPRRLHVHVSRQRRSVEVEIPEQRLSLTTPTCRLAVPAAALQRALDEIARQEQAAPEQRR